MTPDTVLTLILPGSKLKCNEQVRGGGLTFEGLPSLVLDPHCDDVGVTGLLRKLVIHTELTYSSFGSDPFQFSHSPSREESQTRSVWSKKEGVV